MALANDTNMVTEGEALIASVRAAKADTFYRGACVLFERSSGGATVGYAQVDSFAAGDRLAGICIKKQESLALGDRILILVGGLVWLPLGAGVTVANVGTKLVGLIASTTDDPATCTPDTAGALADGDWQVGRILDVTATMMLIDLDPGPIYDQSSTTCWW
jgi:hypothetical protein